MSLRLLALVALLAAASFAQQINSAEATLTFEQRSGPPWPIRAEIPIANGSFQMAFQGTARQPYLLASDPAGSTPGSAFGPLGTLDLDPVGLLFVLDGLTGSVGPLDALARLDDHGNASWTLPMGGSTARELGGFQAAIADPSSLLGVRFTAATDVGFLATPSTLFVSAARGDDTQTGFSRTPLRTLSEAMRRAANSPSIREVRVELGSMPDPGTIALVEGVTVLGGLDAQFANRVGRTTVILSGALQAQGIQQPTHIDSFDFVASTTLSRGALTALYVRDSSSDLLFTRCEFRSPPGVAGAPGAQGAAGSTPPTSAAATPGAGQFGAGNGGAGATTSGAAGAPGSPSFGGLVPGGAGGAASTTFNGNDGERGRNGIDGADGANGTPRLTGVFNRTLLSFIDQNATSGVPGQIGQPGSGGGGGGAGIASAFGLVPFGGGGGAGGASGRRGGAGIGGRSGQSSICVLLVDAGPTFDDCVVRAGSGGRGGDGGSGGSGSLGANGAWGSPGLSGASGVGGTGGRGGDGGDGGRGGSGAGGSGGHSIAIYRASSTLGQSGPPPVFIATTLIFGPGGAAGRGGATLTFPAPAGNPGISQAIYP